jgi:regulator of sirC expression with transglutaminase-like and TPR domain
MLAPELDAPWWHHAFFGEVTARCDLVRSATLISAHSADSALRGISDLDVALLRYDELASGCERTYAAWHRRVFVELGFSGNGSSYHDPRNSFLPFVVERRVGIPISLATVALAIGSRLGLAMWGVGMPGHFLIGVPPTAQLRELADSAAPRFVDGFNGGRILDIASCSDFYSDMFGGRPLIPDQDLQATPNAPMLVRMCANLKSIYARDRNIEGLAAVLRLRTCLPEMTLDEGRELVRLLDATGCWNEARGALDQLFGLFPSPRSRALLELEHDRLAHRLN